MSSFLFLRYSFVANGAILDARREWEWGKRQRGGREAWGEEGKTACPETIVFRVAPVRQRTGFVIG